ncbi:MAG: DUF4041 domain-containing protein [Acidobacteriota bacterium]
MTDDSAIFNPPPGWPKPPEGWKPPPGWSPDPAWPAPPEGWELWLPATAEDGKQDEAESTSPAKLPRGNSEARQADSASVDRVAQLEAENAALRARLDSDPLEDDAITLSDEAVLQEVGIYQYHHPLESAVAYKETLKKLSSRIADQVRFRSAIEVSSRFTFNNSLAQGRRLSSNLSRLMLRAYNAEVDNCLRSLRAGNVVTAKKRVEASRRAIRKLGSIMEMQISPGYHALRLEEIELTADYLIKKKEERLAAREERARLREERRVEAELAAERERLEKERSHLLNALATLRAGGSSDEDLESKLSEVEVAIEHNDYRAANIRAGYVYVISNRGSFGRGVVKIGLTRRLQPLVRVSELSGASVPFRFDVHGLFFSEDAVSLEAELHEEFAPRRVNLANSRKEFFFASPSEVQEALVSKVGSLLEFKEEAEATEYWQSLHHWPEDHRSRNQ